MVEYISTNDLIKYKMYYLKEQLNKMIKISNEKIFYPDTPEADTNKYIKDILLSENYGGENEYLINLYQLSQQINELISLIGVLGANEENKEEIKELKEKLKQYEELTIKEDPEEVTEEV